VVVKGHAGRFGATQGFARNTGPVIPFERRTFKCRYRIGLSPTAGDVRIWLKSIGYITSRFG
jgi:hypothetical protein